MHTRITRTRNKLVSGVVEWVVAEGIEKMRGFELVLECVGHRVDRPDVLLNPGPSGGLRDPVSHARHQNTAAARPQQNDALHAARLAVRQEPVDKRRLQVVLGAVAPFPA
jgi:hypothetical protein